jgi:L-fuconolactonase
VKIDAHTHLWDLRLDPQPWLDPESMSAINRDWHPGDLATMLDQCAVDVAVVVQASNSAAETTRLLGLDHPRIAGVVGWFDLTSDLRPQLEMAPPHRGRLVGVRHLVHMESDPDWLRRREVGQALDTLGDVDLGFDLVLRAAQLPLAAEITAAHENTRFVLDHLGGLADAEDRPAWEAGLREIARKPNVVAKISGLAGLAQNGDDIHRLVDIAIEVFGPQRLMYGSDWPLAQLGAGAPAWRQTVTAAISRLSEDEQARIDAETASEHYRIVT